MMHESAWPEVENAPTRGELMVLRDEQRIPLGKLPAGSDR